ncbi:TetR/AcrR family transcriptional regulator [Rhodococcus sp. MEB064]|uniref:TetR/AcrR family transcriptional regulator n=1 Tax=Rhodococcus sp. MEB064 TaxID=1587522 RepID=UPI0005AC42EF|nr:TetR/AcrR family transcriptional regulator [Rhodococcus sp. MEB064]KIQ08025.1 hypothetical protein RU01_21755 [Rhodococcus sp. MEB064]
MSGLRTRPSASERLLATASELFYTNGIRAVGIDRILDESNVAKSTMYAHFRTKEHLVAAYLYARSDAARHRVTSAVEHGDRSPAARVMSAFDVFGDFFAEPGFRGCPFVNASAEFPADATVQAAIAYDRTWLPALFTRILEPAIDRAAPDLAAALAQLYDGAVVSAYLDRAPDSASTAERTARILLDAHGVA